MCAIFGSKDLDTLKMLADLNANRGGHGFSIMQLTRGDVVGLVKSLGFLDSSVIQNLENDGSLNADYYLCHTQAPTNGKTNNINRVHPSILPINVDGEEKKTYLFHNGIMHDSFSKENARRMADHYSIDIDLFKWDTLLLHAYYIAGLSLSNAHGQFSCVCVSPIAQHDGVITLFRNSSAPMYMFGTDLSSTKFDGSSQTTPNEIAMFDYNSGLICTLSEFRNLFTPYYLG